MSRTTQSRTSRIPFRFHNPCGRKGGGPDSDVIESDRRLFGLAVVLFAIGALSGLGQITVFRQDPGGVPSTASGTGHVVLAGVSSILCFVGAILYGFAFRK